MKIHRRALAVALACAPLAGLLPLSAQAQKPIVLGFSQVGAESEWRTANTESIKSAAKEAGIELKFSDAQQKQENQIKAIRSFIAQKVDVIAFSPVVETGWEPVLQEIHQAGIPVILTDRAVDVSDPSLYETFIGSDFVEEGRKAGKWLAEKTGGKAQIAELVGTPGSAPAIDRKKGFEEAIAKYPDMKIIKSQSGDFTRAISGARPFGNLRASGHQSPRPAVSSSRPWNQPSSITNSSTPISAASSASAICDRSSTANSVASQELYSTLWIAWPCGKNCSRIRSCRWRLAPPKPSAL